IPGAPAGKPYRAIWDEVESQYWRDGQYCGRTLQVIREKLSASNVLFKQKINSRNILWSINQDSEETLRSFLAPFLKVNLTDLAIWYGRNQDVLDLNELISWFKAKFPVATPFHLNTLYEDELPDDYASYPFTEFSIDQDEYAELVGAAPTT